MRCRPVGEVQLPDRRAPLFVGQPLSATLLFDPTPTYSFDPSGGSDQALGPVTVDRTGGKVHDLRAGRGDPRLVGLVRETDDGVGVRDVQRLADERHAEGCVESGQEHGPQLRLAVPVGVPQQRDAVGAGHRPAGLLLEPLEEPAPDPLVVLGPRGRVGLGHEHVAVREHVQPARVVQASGERRHGRSLRGHRLARRGPAFRRDDVDQRDERRVRLRKRWLRPRAGGNRELRGRRAAKGAERRDRQHESRDTSERGRAPGSDHPRPPTRRGARIGPDGAIRSAAIRPGRGARLASRGSCRRRGRRRPRRPPRAGSTRR